MSRQNFAQSRFFTGDMTGTIILDEGRFRLRTDYSPRDGAVLHLDLLLNSQTLPKPMIRTWNGLHEGEWWKAVRAAPMLAQPTITTADELRRDIIKPMVLSLAEAYVEDIRPFALDHLWNMVKP